MPRGIGAATDKSSCRASPRTMAKGLPTSSSPAHPAAPALRSLLHPPRRRAGCGTGSSTRTGTSPSSVAAPSVHHPLLLLLIGRRLQQSQGLGSVLSAHARVLKSGLSRHATTVNHLINAYVRHGDAARAEHAFEDMSGSANVVSWTSVMAGHVAAGRPDRALSLLRGMPEGGVRPNAFTLCTAVNACAALAIVEAGRQVHAVAEVSGLRNDLVVSTALVDMYGKSNRVDDARHVFDRMQRRNVVSWGSMLSVYAQNARAHEVLDLFSQFLRGGGGGGGTSFPPNHFMLCSLASACASLGRLGPGKSAHAAVIRRGHGENDVIAGALVDMYAKCGCIEYSQKVFRLMGSPTVVPFTAMIVAAARHGLVNVSLELFDDMLARGLRPNEVTFVGVLHACSHAGLVDRGLEYLDSMNKCHGVRPSSKHYTCAVDMLGRAGRLDEAYNISKGMEVEGEEAVLLWTTLLSAGRKHKRLDVVDMARARLQEYGKDMAGAYVMMSNTYAEAGRWEHAIGVRMEMMGRGIRKDPGCSWVEVKDVVQVFYVGDASSCGRGEEVLQMVRELEKKMREMGYAQGGGTTDLADDEELAGKPAAGLHSERLALAFALISLPQGGTIRVMKNLRVCGDCHEAFKLTSAIVGRKLVVRDLNRFHHFSGGTCTCGDYW